jgi:hypothetical protein
VLRRSRNPVQPKPIDSAGVLLRRSVGSTALKMV